MVFDVTWTDKKITEFFTNFIKVYGGIDILVYAAGSHGSLPFDTCTSESFDDSFSVDLKGCYFVCQSYVNSNFNSTGQVIIISSISSFKPALTAGQMAKWALRGFLGGLAEYCAKKNINVFGIAPGHLTKENNIEERILNTVKKMCDSPEIFDVGEIAIID